MRYSGVQIVFQEIPTEVSLAFQIAGCSLRCPGCHSRDMWNHEKGNLLDCPVLTQLLGKYRGYISCVLYLGGEWHKADLIEQLDLIRSCDLKTALYTGLQYSQVSDEILSRLDFLKYGEYRSELGPLSSPTTNQRLINLKTSEILNHYFTHGGNDDSVK